MRIGLLAPPWVEVPPRGYGGTEAVVDNLARGLAARGHEVKLFTVGSSTCPVPKAWRFPQVVSPMGAAVPEAAHVLDAYDALADADVIHDHTMLGPLLSAGRALPGAALVTTAHGAFTADSQRLYSTIAGRVALVAISHHQRSTAPRLPVAAVIHHGIDLRRHTYGPGGGGYLLFVGRMAADKGADRAIRVSRAAGRRLVVVTKMRDDEERDYFDTRVRPLLGGDVDLRGEVDQAGRIELMRHADALLDPISWPEPFGLVMAEALACGTPVLACPQGAAPEIVDPGVTGFLCEGEEEMVAAAHRIGEIHRGDCRAVAVARFSLERMTADHEHLYSCLLADQRPATVGAVERPTVASP